MISTTRKTRTASALHSVVVLLRSINVGGKRKVAMADLRCTLEASGCSDVTTNIQRLRGSIREFGREGEYGAAVSPVKGRATTTCQRGPWR
jgi:hypothetical protein